MLTGPVIVAASFLYLLLLFAVAYFGDKRAEILSEQTGFVLGMHLHPQVVPGRALFHVAYDFKDL